MDQREKKQIIDNIIKELLSCSDGKYITEIYAENGSVKNGEFADWISLIVVLNEHFSNESLYHCMNTIEDKYYPFTLSISCELDMEDRGTGVVLWKK